MPLESHVRETLDNFTFSLSLVLGDDAKINREVQMMHSIQMSLGNKTDSLAPTSEYETTAFCLFFDDLKEKGSRLKNMPVTTPCSSVEA